MACICLDDIPPESLVGLDLQSWQTGPNFRGLSGITPGVHILHIAISGLLTTKFAIWLRLSKESVVSYKWDKKSEFLVPLHSAPPRSSARPGMISWPVPDGREWESVTKYLDPELLSEIVDVGQVVTSTTQSTVDADILIPSLLPPPPPAAAAAAAPARHDTQTTETGPAAGVSAQEKATNQEEEEEEVKYRFLKIDMKRSWPPGAIGREITTHALDKSWLLSHTLSLATSPARFMGHFQFCFLGVLMYSSISAFDQWTTILRLFCSARALIRSRPDLFSSFLVIVHDQMKLVSEELYHDIFALTLPRHLNLLSTAIATHRHHGTHDDDHDDDEREEEKVGAVREAWEVLVDFLHREFGEDEGRQMGIYPLDEPRGDEYLDDDEGMRERGDEEEEEEEDERPVVVEL